MSNHKDLINQAIHNYYHEDTELEMELKDYFNDVQNKAQAFDEIADVKSSLDICEDYTLEHSYDEDPVFEEMYYINQVVRFICETIEQVEDDDQ